MDWSLIGAMAARPAQHHEFFTCDNAALPHGELAARKPLWDGLSRRVAVQAAQKEASELDFFGDIGA
jgi:hypothetical protein